MTKADLRKRLKKIFKETKGISTILLVNTSSPDPNFLYVSGFEGGPFEGNIVILKKNSAELLTSILEYEDMEKQKPKGMDVIEMKSAEQVKRILSKNIKGRPIGINGDFLPYTSYSRIKLRYKPKRIIDVSDAFAKTRLVKEDSEVKMVRKAAMVTKKAMFKIKKKLKVGVTEKEIADAFDEISRKLGSEGPSFSTIVCFGRNSAVAHHNPDSTKLKYGDFVLIDAGAKSGNYCSDITRTFIFGKDKARIKYYEKKLEIYRIVKEAQLKAIKAIKEGVKSATIHNIAEDYIAKAEGGKYKKFVFEYALGHSIGIEVHDPGGGLSPNSKLKLKQGIITSVEPGIYMPGFGGVRLEDDILVTKDGAVVL